MVRAVRAHKNGLHQSPTPISLRCHLSFGQLSDYCVGMDCEQWIHSSLENLQQPIWLSTPISHTAHHPFVLRIESEAGGDSTCQQNNGCLPQSREDTPECLMVKLIMSSSWLEQRATVNSPSPVGTMKMHMAFPFWSLARSVLRHSPLRWLWSTERLNTFQVKLDGIKQVCFVGDMLCSTPAYITGCHWWWRSFLPTTRWR